MATTRDLTKAQFLAACKRNSFKPILGGLWLEDETSKNLKAYGAVCTMKGKLLRRETLAHALASRKRDAAKKRAALSKATA